MMMLSEGSYQNVETLGYYLGGNVASFPLLSDFQPKLRRAVEIRPVRRCARYRLARQFVLARAFLPAL